MLQHCVGVLFGYLQRKKIPYIDVRLRDKDSNICIACHALRLHVDIGGKLRFSQVLKGAVEEIVCQNETEVQLHLEIDHHISSKL